MADSPSHKFGQIVGNLLEDIIEPTLKELAKKNNLYVDKKGNRKARGSKKKVTWIDSDGNKHDLDFVFEAEGSEEKQGEPVAFVESAWRRYTKHSRAKSQEIEGALLPLARKFELKAPFLGVVLGGVFTGGSLNQLKSHNFKVLYISYESIMTAFKKGGLNAEYEEDSPHSKIEDIIDKWNNLSQIKKDLVKKELLKTEKIKIKKFTDELQNSFDRKIKSIRIMPLHGEITSLSSLKKSTRFH